MSGYSKIYSLTDFPISATYSQHTWTDRFKGIDYATPLNTPCTVLKEGIVTRVFWDNQGGNCLEVKDDKGMFWQYIHLTKIPVRVGQRLKIGDLAIITGATGSNVTGPHCHVNLWPNSQMVKTIDPQPYILSNNDMNEIIAMLVHNQRLDVRATIGWDVPKLLEWWNIHGRKETRSKLNRVDLDKLNDGDFDKWYAYDYLFEYDNIVDSKEGYPYKVRDLIKEIEKLQNQSGGDIDPEVEKFKKSSYYKEYLFFKDR